MGMAVAALGRRAFIVGGHVTRFIGPKHPDFIPIATVRSFPTKPPRTRHAQPGDIMAMYVVGAGRDGRPVHNSGGRTFRRPSAERLIVGPMQRIATQ